MIGISIRQLEVFVSIANMGSVRQAADKLHLSQPAVSMALAELERQLGNQLFDRERGRLYINHQGREQLPVAMEILQRLQDMENNGLNQQEDLVGELHIGASNTVGNYLVGELLGPMSAQHKSVVLQLTVDNTRDISRLLLDHSIDLACVEGPVNHPSLESINWRQDKLVICCAYEHELASKTSLQANDFIGARWILRELGSATRSQTEQLLTALPKGQIILELGQIEAIKQAVIAGLGIACLPLVATTDAVQTKKIKILETPFLQLERNLSVLLHKGRYQASLIKAFLKTLGLNHHG